jgi:hypothetical protein
MKMMRMQKTIRNLLRALVAVGAILVWSGAASAEPPLGILGDVTVQNDEGNPVPVTVTNLPEPAAPEVRIPFSQTVVATCNDFNCRMDFEPVPEGMQLLISFVSAAVRPVLTTTVVDQAVLSTSNTFDSGFGVISYFPMARIGQSGDSVLADTWAMNAQLTAFVRAGLSPRLVITIRDEGEIFFSEGTVSGYLIGID